MDLISGLLSKYKDQLAASGQLKEEILSIIKARSGIELEREQVSIKNNHLYLKVSPKIKLGVLLYREAVIAEINQAMNKKLIVDIR